MEVHLKDKFQKLTDKERKQYSIKHRFYQQPAKIPELESRQIFSMVKYDDRSNNKSDSECCC